MERPMAGSRKKVVVRKEDQTVQAGYLPASGVVNRATGDVELLDVSGRLLAVPLREIRYVAYVRDFNLDDPVMPERLTRKTFLARPRTEGLWVRVSFRDGEVLEGLAGLDVSLMDDAMTDSGIYLLPPDVRSNTQRLFVPRAAMAGVVVLGVVTTPSKVVVEPRARKTHEGEMDLPFPDAALR
jgi:hypothetical protein